MPMLQWDIPLAKRGNELGAIATYAYLVYGVGFFTMGFFVRLRPMNKLSDEQKLRYLTQLDQHPLFRVWLGGQAVPSVLLSKVHLHHYPKNSLIYLQYDKVRYLYFLLDGAVNCYRQLPNGQEGLISHFDSKTHQAMSQQGAILINETLPKPHDPKHAPSHERAYSKFGLGALQNHHLLTAKTKKSSWLALVPITEMMDMLYQHTSHELTHWYMTQMNWQLSTQFLLYDLLSLKTAHTKVAYYLLAHANMDGVVVIHISQKNLASHLGIRAETLSRTLRSLVNSGVIKHCSAGFCIEQVGALTALVD